MRRNPSLTAATLFVVLCGVVFFCLEWHSEQRRLALCARASNAIKADSQPD